MSNNHSGDEQKRLAETQQEWDASSATFDEEPDHGLRDPVVREAWTKALQSWLKGTGSRILDIGCGTGSLSVIMAEMGHTVTGIDLSPAMIALARKKAEKAGQRIDFQVMDAAHPRFLPRQFDVVVCRHLLWALPEPRGVLLRWMELLNQPGRLILIEGFWHTGAGLRAEDVRKLLPAALGIASFENLSDAVSLWGGPVTDERYAVIADLQYREPPYN